MSFYKECGFAGAHLRQPRAWAMLRLPMSLPDLIGFAASTFTTLFFVVDAPATVPMFLSITATESPEERKATAFRASVALFGVLSAFALLGGYLFAWLGISLGAFRIAGGVLLFLLAVDMLHAKPSRTRSSPEEAAEGRDKTDVSIFPLAIPMLAGPGASSTAMVIVSRAKSMAEYAIVALCIAVVALLVYWILRSANWFEKRLGHTGMNVIERVMGLILAATAVQFVVDGIQAALPALSR
jgi:multiple antibiotic resistance protein